MPDLIDGKGVMVQFRAKNITKEGFDISNISNAQWEEEVLVKPNTKFKITNIDKKRQVITNSQNSLIDVDGNTVDEFDVYYIDTEVIE